MTIIVGAGLAGWRLAQVLDKFWFETGDTNPLKIFGEDTGPLDKIALGEWATGRRTEPPSLIDQWRRTETQFIPRPVVRISPTQKTVTDTSGTVHRWDRLVLATGSEPVIPPTFAGPFRRVFPVSERVGAAGLRLTLQGLGRRILVIGGGPLGVETAWNLAEQGHRAALSHRGPRLLEPFFDAEGSELLAHEWDRRGVAVFLNNRETSYRETEQGCEVTFENGGIWAGDAVVLACGTRPRTALAEEAGLKASSSGVVTDDFGRTSEPGVYAVGDCTVPAPGTPPGLWEPARVQVDRLAAQWCEKPFTVPEHRTVFRLKTPWPAASQGTPEARGQVTTVDRDNAQWKAVENGGLVFWQLLGPWEDLEFRIAGLASGAVSLTARLNDPADRLPDGYVVCDCHRVTAGTVRQAYGSGVRSLAELGHATGAGTSCGSCRARLLGLSEAPPTPGDQRMREFLRPRWNGWSWNDVVGYSVDYGMLVCGVLTAVTGLLKMPGWMEALGIDQRALPDEANMVLSAVLDLHDWPGVILTVLALVHVALHAKQLAGFLKSWFRKR